MSEKRVLASLVDVQECVSNNHECLNLMISDRDMKVPISTDGLNVIISFYESQDLTSLHFPYQELTEQEAINLVRGPEFENDNLE